MAGVPPAQELLVKVCGMPKQEAGQALADALVAGGRRARLAAKVVLEKVCPDESDPCEQGGEGEGTFLAVQAMQLDATPHCTLHCLVRLPNQRAAPARMLS